MRETARLGVKFEASTLHHLKGSGRKTARPFRCGRDSERCSACVCDSIDSPALLVLLRGDPRDAVAIVVVPPDGVIALGADLLDLCGLINSWISLALQGGGRLPSPWASRTRFLYLVAAKMIKTAKNIIKIIGIDASITIHLRGSKSCLPSRSAGQKRSHLAPCSSAKEIGDRYRECGNRNSKTRDKAAIAVNRRSRLVRAQHAQG